MGCASVPNLVKIKQLMNTVSTTYQTDLDGTLHVRETVRIFGANNSATIDTNGENDDWTYTVFKLGLFIATTSLVVYLFYEEAGKRSRYTPSGKLFYSPSWCSKKQS